MASWSGSYAGLETATGQSSGTTSYADGAAGSYAGGSFSLSSYLLQGASAGTYSNSDSSKQTSGSATSSFAVTQGGQASDTVYQSGTQNTAGYSNGSYTLQEKSTQSVSEASSGPTYASSDTWQQQSSFQQYASGSGASTSLATYSYHDGSGAANMTNSNSATLGTSGAGAVVQLVAPDGAVVPTDGGDAQATAGAAGTGGDAPVAVNVPVAEVVSTTGSWMTQTDGAAMRSVNWASSTTTGGTSGGITPQGWAILSNATAAPGLSAATAAALSSSFLPAPAPPMRTANYGAMAWNALQPLFQLMGPLGVARTAAAPSSVQALLGVQSQPTPTYNNGSGDPFVNWVDEVLYNNGQPLTTASLPLYGLDGNTNQLDAFGQAGELIMGMCRQALFPFMFTAAAPLALAADAGMALIQGDYLGAALDVIGIGMSANWTGFAFPGVGAGSEAEAAAQAGENTIGLPEGGLGGARSSEGVLGDIGASRGQWMREAGAGGEAAGEAAAKAEAEAEAAELGACFSAGTPLLVPGGSKAVERFNEGDLVLSRAEGDPNGAVEAKVVEKVFVRTGEVLQLHVACQVIRTTPRHPFYAQGKGWVQANELLAGDELLGDDGRWHVVENLQNTGEYEIVYNLRVGDFHTYFVGSEEWGFSAWAHNACSSTSGETKAASEGRQAHKEFDWSEGFEKEVRLPSGKRADAVNLETQTVGELKPNNPRAVRRGQNQLAEYAKELEDITRGPWKRRMETY